MTLQIGLYAPTWPGADRATPRWPAIRALGRDAEALGVDTFWVADEPGFWECWTILTALAEATTTIGIGPLIACTRYRSPALFATMVRALDEVSGGRVTLGLGSGSGPSDRRWTAFGFDATSHVARFGEAVEIIARLVRDGPTTFDGRFYTIADPDIGPAGPTAGGPPIWVAGGKPRTMEVAARWGDAINDHDALPDAWPPSPRSASAPRSRARPPAATRPPSTLTGWVRVAPSPDGRLDADREDTIAGTPAAIAERLAAIHEAGIAHLTVFIGDEDDGHDVPGPHGPRARALRAGPRGAPRIRGIGAPGRN